MGKNLKRSFFIIGLVNREGEKKRQVEMVAFLSRTMVFGFVSLLEGMLEAGIIRRWMLGQGSCWKSSRMFNHFWSFQKVTCFSLQNHPAQMKGEPC